MKVYWPCAIRLRDDGTEETLFTYDSTLKWKLALETLKNWRGAYKFNLVRCWVDVYEGDKKVEVVHVDLEKNIRGEGGLTYETL